VSPARCWGCGLPRGQRTSHGGVPTPTMRMGAMPHWLELEQRRSVILPLQQVAVWIHIADPGVGPKRHIG
jgi:hypothetical protein